MSTIYTFHNEMTSLTTPATGDRLLVNDASASAQKDMTLAVMSTAALAGTSTGYVGLYGASAVQQGSFTATATAAIATNPTFSASNTGAGVFGFASSTVMTAYVTRIQQMQTDLDTLIDRCQSTGLIG